MFAFEIPNLRFSLPAGMYIERCRFVSVNADGNGVTATAETFFPIGVSMNRAEDGQVLEIADGIVMVEAGGAITAGAYVSCDEDGRAAIIDGGPSLVVALTGASAAGELITVKI